MKNVLPEMKEGDRIINSKTGYSFLVISVERGREFDEPVYKLQGRYGVKLTAQYTGEELTSLGYVLKE